MLFFFFILVFYFFKQFNIFFWNGWLDLDWKISLIQLILMFFTFRLFFIKNNYQLVGYSFLFIVSLSIYLFFLQLDVFACFLLISESIVMLFVLTMLIHLNSNNLLNILKKKNILLVFFLLITIFFYNNWDSSYYNYYVDWYLTQDSGYNDLISQYIYFYKNKYIVIFIAFWLLILTFLLVNITLSCYSSHLNQSDIHSITYIRKSQNIWKQWYTKPITRFFN